MASAAFLLKCFAVASYPIMPRVALAIYNRLEETATKVPDLSLEVSHHLTSQPLPLDLFDVKRESAVEVSA